MEGLDLEKNNKENLDPLQKARQQGYERIAFLRQQAAMMGNNDSEMPSFNNLMKSVLLAENKEEVDSLVKQAEQILDSKIQR